MVVGYHKTVTPVGGQQFIFNRQQILAIDIPRIGAMPLYKGHSKQRVQIPSLKIFIPSSYRSGTGDFESLGGGAVPSEGANFIGW